MEKRYVTCSRKFDTYHSLGKDTPVEWRDIPKDHSDPNIRSYYPGEWAPHPVDETHVFIFPKVK